MLMVLAPLHHFNGIYISKPMIHFIRMMCWICMMITSLFSRFTPTIEISSNIRPTVRVSALTWFIEHTVKVLLFVGTIFRGFYKIH
jgi:hypothetical protein